MFIKESFLKQKKLQKDILIFLNILIHICIMFVSINPHFHEYFAVMSVSQTFIDPAKVFVPFGFFIYCFQSIRYMYAFRYDENQFRLYHFNFSNWVITQSFFPKFFCGAISNYEHDRFEFNKRFRLRLINIVIGSQKIIWGLFKKLVIADRLYQAFIDYPVISVSSISIYEHLVFISLCFIYIVATATGLHDIGLGVAKIFDVELYRNFQVPLFPESLRSFWDKWFLTIGQSVSEYHNEMDGKSRKSIFKYLLIIFLSTLFYVKFDNYLFFILGFGIFITLETFIIVPTMPIKNTIWQKTYKLLALLLTMFIWGTLFTNISGTLTLLKSSWIYSGFLDDYFSSRELIIILISLPLFLFFSYIQKKSPLRDLSMASPLWIKVFVILLILTYILMFGVI